MALKGLFNGSPLIPQRGTLLNKWNAVGWKWAICGILMKKWGKSMKWAEKTKISEKWAFLSGMCLNKGFLVESRKLKSESYCGRPMDRERNCKKSPKIIKKKKNNYILDFCRFSEALLFNGCNSFQGRPMDREKNCKKPPKIIKKKKKNYILDFCRFSEALLFNGCNNFQGRPMDGERNCK